MILTRLSIHFYGCFQQMTSAMRESTERSGSTILRPLTFARNYATIADRKRQNSKGICRGNKTNGRKLCAAGNTEPVPKRISGDGSAPPRFLVAVNFALQSACFRNPPVLLRYGSSSRKIFALQIFFGSPVLLGFPVIIRLFFRGVCLAAGAGGPAALVYAKHTPRCQSSEMT